MDIAIGLTVIFFVVLPILGMIVNGDDGADRVIGLFVGLYIAFWLSAATWIIYVVAHFVTKYW